jgi:asparagine synthase (glutamine-hydrolysing)
MTIMAGIYSRSGEKPSPRICGELRRLLSRHEGDRAVELGNDRVWMAKIDIGAFGSAGIYVDGEGGFSLLTGEPLVGDSTSDRYSDLKALHREWLSEDWGSTSRTRGAFCAACYSPRKQQLRLITDRLGLRGLHYVVYDQFVLFATAFRIIEALISVDHVLDVGGVAELATFGMPLGDRTTLLGVKRLMPAEAVIIDPRYARQYFYWSWDSIAPSDNEAVVERLHDTFMTAISLRLKGDRSTFAFLSGGLDSRSIVAGLTQQGVTVRTANISRPQTQDRALGRRFADTLGIEHIECGPVEGPWWKSIASAVTLLGQSVSGSGAPERPRLVWNGEGGSCGFGHIHLTEPIVDLARTGDRTTFVREFCSYNTWSTSWQRILRRPWSDLLCAEVERRLRDEMSRTAPRDPGRVPYFFLLFNDQRRKLDALHDNADLIRAEMLTPFYDIEFLSGIVASDFDLFIGHKLYVKWLHLFRSEVCTVPWQAYPGHVPCPVPVPADLEYQWASDNPITADDRKFLRAMIAKSFHPKMPGWLIRREVMLAAAALTLLGIRDYRYLLLLADIFATAWEKLRLRDQQRKPAGDAANANRRWRGQRLLPFPRVSARKP